VNEKVTSELNATSKLMISERMIGRLDSNTALDSNFELQFVLKQDTLT